ncbi:hypothetical protein H0H87_006519 [Tephrocybe sp. NHM501043]|nr:hypothetical protein H0H87_006519 [Tephrocybe sp. NHM501043]
MTVPIPPVATQPQPGRIPLRIAVVQLRPKIGQVKTNIERARELCFKLQPHTIDLLCFPEMAFTGYVFDSAAAIFPYLEEPRTGPSSLFCQEVAKYLGCYVAGGYPERLSDEERLAQPKTSEAQISVVPKDALPVEGMEIPPSDNISEHLPSASISAVIPQIKHRNVVGANSAIIYSPEGEWIGGYRKTNLFKTDETWAKAGTGFKSFSLPLSPTPLDSIEAARPPLNMTIGICMDLNPQPPNNWKSVDGPFEIAEHCIENRSRLLVMLNAWLFSNLNENGETTTVSAGGGGSDTEELDEAKTEGNDAMDEEKELGRVAEEDEGTIDPDEDEPDWYTLRYWTARLEPLWRRDLRRRGSNETIMSNSSNVSDRGSDKPKGEEQGVVEAVEEEEEEEEEDKAPHETIVVVCNRSGKENGETFAGSSAIFSMRSGSGRPRLLDMMGKDEEGVRVWNILV